MKVILKVFAGLNQYLNPPPKLGESVTIEINEDSTIQDLLNSIGIPRDVVSIIFLDGVHAPLTAKLHDGAKVSLFPPVGGG